MKNVLKIIAPLLAVFVLGSASAALTKYKTSFQDNGAAAVEGEISYTPTEGGKKTKTSAIESFIGSPKEIVATLDQPWKRESDLAAITSAENCASQGGTLENVTVKAGTFKACKVHSVSSGVEITKWTGAVAPTGLLRMDVNKKGGHTREELTEYAQ